MPVGLPPPRTPPAAPPPGGLPPRFSTERGRRTLALFGIGALVLVLGFVVFTGVEFLYLVRGGGSSQVSSAVPSGLPHEVPLCTGFIVQRSFSGKLDDGLHFLVQGECPENHLQLDDDMTRALEYQGWTVHDDGQGTLSSYSYERRQRLDLGISGSGVSANDSAVTIEVWTNLKRPPDGFAPLPASPSPR